MCSCISNRISGRTVPMGQWQTGTALACGSMCRGRKAAGEVALRSADPFDKPAVDPRYLSDQRDLDLTVDAVLACREIGTAEAFQRIGTREIWPGPTARGRAEVAGFVRAMASTIWHPAAPAGWVSMQWRWWTPGCGCGAWRGSGGGCVDHAKCGQRQYQCYLHHDRAKGGGDGAGPVTFRGKTEKHGFSAKNNRMGGGVDMIEGSCHCGLVQWRFAGEPELATACNCTICRRYGVLWAYDYEGRPSRSPARRRPI